MSSNPPAEARIFVSYNRQDAAITRRFVTSLERAGARVWVDWEGARDGDFLRRINQGLAACDWLALVETPHSLASDPVEMEVNAALNRVLYGQMRGVLRLVAATRDPRSVKPIWAPLQYYDATSDFDGAVAALLAAIRMGDQRRARRPGAEHPGGPTMVAPATPPAMPASAPTSEAQRYLTRMASVSAANDWYTVCDLAQLLLTEYPDDVTTDFYRMQGRALLELARPAEAARALTLAYQRDKTDLPTMRAAARACLQAKDTAAAEPLLLRALTEADDPDEKLDILREYVPTLESLGKPEDALMRIGQALHLRPDDAAWLAARRDQLLKLNRRDEALATARALVNRPDASAADWLTLVRLAPQEIPRMAQELVASGRARDVWNLLSAPASAPAEQAQLTQARVALFPLPDVPERLVSLGFRGVNIAGTQAIIPPLVSVAAGRFLMGSDPKSDPMAKESWAKGELPQDWVEVGAFQLAKYPVTVAEYALAVKAGAVREPPEIGQGHSWHTTWQMQLQRLDHPVVCVSWQDANVYIAWLRKVTGQPGWRLPTEAQWEKAARWDTQRNAGCIYPWGDGFDQHRCNTSESGIGATTPVGAYPASDAQRSGASPCGAEDMAGNVWEWTSSLYKPYKYIESDGREDQNSTDNRVLRGGSWFAGAGNARAAYRLISLPAYVNHYVGFRLAVASPAGAAGD